MLCVPFLLATMTEHFLYFEYRNCFCFLFCYIFVMKQLLLWFYNTNVYNLIANNYNLKKKVIFYFLFKVVVDELTQYFGHYLPISKYPMYIIILTVPANTIDINLEPNKSRVLLQHMVRNNIWLQYMLKIKFNRT